MNWKYVKPLTDDNYISELGSKTKMQLPSEYINCIKLYNGGRPEKSFFKTENGVEHHFMKLLSLNKKDKGSIWGYIIDSDKIETLHFAFAIDDFGNLICFRKKDGAIIFVNLDTVTEEFITDSFASFLKMLYA